MRPAGGAEVDRRQAPEHGRPHHLAQVEDVALHGLAAAALAGVVLVEVREVREEARHRHARRHGVRHERQPQLQRAGHAGQQEGRAGHDEEPRHDVGLAAEPVRHDPEGLGGHDGGARPGGVEHAQRGQPHVELVDGERRDDVGDHGHVREGVDELHPQGAGHVRVADELVGARKGGLGGGGGRMRGGSG